MVQANDISSKFILFEHQWLEINIISRQTKFKKKAPQHTQNKI